MRIESEHRACEFRLLRYVPDPVRNEFVHIGVILRESGATGATGEPTRTEVRFTRDWRRVRCLDPDADTALLEGMESELRSRLQAEADRAEPQGRLMRLLEESLSLSVQMTESRAYLAESLVAGVEDLMRLYVDPPPRERASRLSGRTAIQTRMRSEFERAGVWDLMRKRIAAADYTRPGDPLRIDAGYRPNGLIRMFHAVSLEPGLEMVKVLAFSAAGLRAGVARVEQAELELTAIVEPAAKLGASDENPERLELYRFGVETMEEHSIRVLTVSDLGRVAETARRELRV
ncbi:MAG TPA: DUF3037 domain-containing protein [Terracidiphilus sp.]|jgi:hypothetical protein|nr:DUF3037 domain-containing protein [Terracidiphilus sp.]